MSAAYLAALALAKQMECESVAFPLLASGNNGINPKLAFAIAKECLDNNPLAESLTIYLVVYGDEIAQLVREHGYTVNANPSSAQKLLRKKDNKIENQHKRKELLQKGIDYLKIEENRDKIEKG